MKNVTCNALVDVSNERKRQDAKWGEQNHSPEGWLAILTEEVGEVAEEICNTLGPNGQPINAGNYRYELIQVAAVAVSAVEALDRRLKEQAINVASHPHDADNVAPQAPSNVVKGEE